MKNEKGEKKVTQTEVKRLGFTDKLIKELLPEPELVTNPCYRSAAKMKLWKLSDVETAMETRTFQESFAKRKRYRIAAEKAVETKKAKLRATTNEFISGIHIKKVNTDNLRNRTLNAKQQWYNAVADGRYEIQDAYSADDETVTRWMVNYIRHEMTSYDEQLWDIKGKVGISEAHIDLHDAILDKIALVYPELATECQRQKYTTTE